MKNKLKLVPDFFTQPQTLMALALVAICLLLVMASSAQAASLTLSHCGWLSAQKKDYSTHPRNLRIIQHKLEQLGYSVGVYGATGEMTPETQEAIRSFQSRHILPQDGTVNAYTAQILAYTTHPLPNVQRCKGPAKIASLQ